MIGTTIRTLLSLLCGIVGLVGAYYGNTALLIISTLAACAFGMRYHIEIIMLIIVACLILPILLEFALFLVYVLLDRVYTLDWFRWVVITDVLIVLIKTIALVEMIRDAVKR